MFRLTIKLEKLIWTINFFFVLSETNKMLKSRIFVYFFPGRKLGVICAFGMSVFKSFSHFSDSLGKIDENTRYTRRYICRICKQIFEKILSGCCGCGWLDLKSKFGNALSEKVAEFVFYHFSLKSSNSFVPLPLWLLTMYSANNLSG